MSFLPTDWPSFFWGAAVGAVILFATGFLQKAGEHVFDWLKQRFIPGPAKISEHDRSLFTSFKALFSDTGLIKHYKEQDFLLPFKQSYLVPLHQVVEHWQDESHNFVNPMLQQAKIAFIKAASSLSDEIGRYTVPNNNGSVSVITQHMDPENLPVGVREEAKAIDAKLPAFINAHEELVRLGNSLC